MANDFEGKLAWITGGASGFGAAAARRLAAAGATVVISDVQTETGLAVAEEIGGSFHRCDVSSYDEVVATVDAVVAAHGKLDIAFLNAGIGTDTYFGPEFDVAKYRRAMGVNLDGVVFGMQAALTAMASHPQDGGCDIVATASLAGLTSVPFDPIYGANKHAVVGLVRAAGAVSPNQGVRINALCPGFADTAIVVPELKAMLDAQGLPLIEVSVVVDALMQILEAKASGECWWVQLGRGFEPFRFRGIPGPRIDQA